MKKKLFYVVILLLFLGCRAIYIEIGEVKQRLSTTHFVWNNGISLEADRSFKPFRLSNKHSTSIITRIKYWFSLLQLNKIKRGDVIFVKAKNLKTIYGGLDKRNKGPVVLVIADTDVSVPSDFNFDFDKLLNHPMVYHCFSQNCDYEGKSTKISHLPIGIDFHTLAERDFWGESIQSTTMQEEQLQGIIETLLPIKERDQRVFIDFHLSDTSKRFSAKGYETRTEVANYFKESPLVLFQGGKRKRSDQWRERGKYAFSLCHFGNGMDCHRTWESLALGNIVIVKRSPLDPLYEGLPVVIVDDWNEVTKSNLDKWAEKYHDTMTNPQYRGKITHNFWMNKIKEKSRECKDLS